MYKRHTDAGIFLYQKHTPNLRWRRTFLRSAGNSYFMLHRYAQSPSAEHGKPQNSEVFGMLPPFWVTWYSLFFFVLSIMMFQRKETSCSVCLGKRKYQDTYVGEIVVVTENVKLRFEGWICRHLDLEWFCRTAGNEIGVVDINLDM